MDYFKTKLKPIELTIEPVEEIADQHFRIKFLVKFAIVPFFGRALLFESKGVVDANERLDEKSLTKILKTTDYEKFLASNMKRRDFGSFNYEYLINDNWLTIRYTTF